MTLKGELQAIDPEKILNVYNAYLSKVGNLPGYEEELAPTQEYAGLMVLMGAVIEKVLDGVLSSDEAELVLMGAGMIVIPLIELAEVQELPPIG